MRKLFASLCLLFALGAPVQAQECRLQWSAAQANMAPDKGWVAVELKGDDLARFVANFNAEEPKSDYHPDSVWVLHDTNYVPGFVNVAFVTGECVDLLLIDVPEPAFENTLFHVPGDPA